MKDDEEFERLLSEIPYETTRNLHYPQRDGHHVHGGHDHDSLVRQTMNGVLYGNYDDDPASYFNYNCASPGSGFSLQSEGSSSSLLSIGHSFSDGGSPIAPPLEELKSHMPNGISHHPNGLFMDFNVPDPSIGVIGPESMLDELKLSRNMGRMYINDPQDNYRRGAFDYEGPWSSVPQSTMYFDEGMSSGLWRKYNLDSSRDLHFPRDRADGLFSQTNCYNSTSTSPCYRMKGQPSNYYQRVVPASHFASSRTGTSVANAFLYSQKNGMNLNEERAAFNLAYMPLTSHQLPDLGVKNTVYSNPPMLDGWAKEPSNFRFSQQALEAFTSEDSLIIQGEGLNGVMNKGRNCKGYLHDFGLKKPHKKRTGLDGYPPYACLHDNRQSERQYCSSTLWNSLAEAQGDIYLMAKHQNGCRFLQSMFRTPQDVEIIFIGIIDHVVELMMNPFGNYLMQKLLEVCNDDQRMQILLMITAEPSQLVRISLNTHGTRVVQKLIETLKTGQEISLVISALQPGFLTLIKDVNGNHVVQRCLQCLSNKDNKFIFVAAAKHCIDIATHQHGCCVLQRCISASTGVLRDNLVAKISANGLLLAQDRYGNYVIQFVLEQKIPSATSSLISQFEGNYVQLSTQKFSSHVVERCLLVFDDEMRSKIIHELLFSCHFEHLLQDPHANYVVQTALQASKGSVHNLLVDTIRSYKAISCNSPYSKRIYSQKLLKK